MNIYDYKVEKPNGEYLNLKDLKGKVILIVNTATGCGFTPQYKELEEIDIPKYSDDITINTSEYSIIEKGIWARENFTSELNKENLVDELNEFAHINSKLKICLNPYKFTFCTKRLYNYLNELNIS